MTIRTASQRPVVLALTLHDRNVVDARLAQAHEASLIELPILITVRAEPGSRIVVPFVSKPHGDAIFMEGPELFDEPVVEFLGPLAGQKSDDFLPASQEFRTVSPAGIRRVSQRHLFGIAGIPRVVGQPSLLDRGFAVVWRKRRTRLYAHRLPPA